MKRVFVPMASGSFEKDTAIFDFSRETYITKLLKYNMVPIFVSVLAPKNTIDELYAECGGVLCMGGTDFNPKLYDQTAHPKTKINEPKRDELEIYVIKKVLTDKKPYLGICRGAQGLAIAAGGSLNQHFADLVPDEYHGQSESITYGDIRGNGHEILVEPGSRAYALVGKPRINVNCGHHQSVKYPGQGLSVSGKSPDGIIEIIESTDPNHFCFGLQSHPETEDNGDCEIFFREFGNAVKEYK